MEVGSVRKKEKPEIVAAGGKDRGGRDKRRVHGTDTPN